MGMFSAGLNSPLGFGPGTYQAPPQTFSAGGMGVMPYYAPEPPGRDRGGYSPGADSRSSAPGGGPAASMGSPAQGLGASVSGFEGGNRSYGPSGNVSPSIDVGRAGPSLGSLGGYNGSFGRDPNTGRAGPSLGGSPSEGPVGEDKDKDKDAL